MKLLQNIKYFYDNLKIQTKFRVAILFAVVIPILTLAIAFSGRLYEMVIADTIRSEQEAAAKTAPRIEASLKEITDIRTSISEQSYYRTLFDQEVNAPLSELASTTDANHFSEYIRELTANDSSYAVRIYMDLPGQEDFFSSESAENLFLPISEAKGTYWHGIFQGSGNTELYCPPFYLGSREKSNYGDSAYITSASILYDGTAYPCYLAIYYASSVYQTILSEGISFHGGVSYILNDREAIIASTDDYLAGIYRLNYSEIRESLLSSNSFIERDVLGEKFYVGFYYIKDPGWFMVTALPNQPLIEKSNLIILKFISICLICIFSATMVAMLLSRSITTRISSVIDQMTQIKKGPPVPMAEPVVHDEVGELISTYNYMTEKMNLLIDEQRKTAEELRIAEFNSLQAQINPHFLYNTMDMINWMALAGNTTEISSAVQNLAKFYKLTLSRKNDFSTIASEAEHVSIYVDLQNMRYQNAIDFIPDIPDELLECSIPKLTLQPIVENAILHGILEKEEKSGTIVITGWTEDDTAILLISDDGVGIPDTLLPLILSEGNYGHSTGANIAIYNIHKRLKLLYGAEYGLSYSSEAGQGTVVRICIPVHLTKKAVAEGASTN